jgi:DNA-binding CsgD family transcriptional regulator
MMNDFSNNQTKEECLVQRVLNWIPIGIYLIDSDSRICFMNFMAKNIIAKNDGLSVIDEKLQADNAEESEKLSQLIIQATQDSEYCNEEIGEGVITISRPSMSRAYNVLIYPIRTADPSIPGLCEFSAPIVIIIIGDPEHIPKLSSKTFNRLYNLTKAETKLLTLLNGGDTLAQIADHMSISKETAHFHLQNVFIKTDTHRQSELVGLIRNTPPAYWCPIDR